MKPLVMTCFLSLGSLVVSVAAAAQPAPPAGSGMVPFTEKLKVGSGCDSLSDSAVLDLTIGSDGSWLASTPLGDVSGTLVAADTQGRAWDLEFDSASLALYETYLEFVATSLCGTGVSIVGLEVDRFQLKFGKDLAQVAFQLKASGEGSTGAGTGGGKHSVKGKGSFTPSP